MTDQEVIDAFIKAGRSQRATAKAINKSRSQIQRILKRCAGMIPPEGTPAPELLPPSDLPFEERLDYLKRRNRTRIEHERAKAWQAVRIPVAGPYGVAWFGDPHLDDPFCDLDAIERHARICAETEGLYGANGGDSINNWVGRLEGLHANQNVTQEEAWELVDWFMNRLGVRWLLWVLGNHDMWNHGRYIFERTGAQRILMRDWDAKLRLISPCGGVVRAWVRHDFKGSSIYNELHGLKRAAMQEEHADIYAAFHRHTFASGQGELPGGRDYCIIRARGYKEYDFHSRVHQFPEQRTGQTVVTVIEPNPDGPPLIHAFRDVQRGADFLTMIREEWKRENG